MEIIDEDELVDEIMKQDPAFTGWQARDMISENLHAALARVILQMYHQRKAHDQCVKSFPNQHKGVCNASPVTSTR